MEWFPERAGGLNRVFFDCIQHLPQAGINARGLVVGSPNIERDTNRIVSSFAPPSDSLLQRWYKQRLLAKRILLDQDYPLVVSHFALYTFPILDILGDRPLVTHFQGPWALESLVEHGGAKTMGIRLRQGLEQVCYNRTQKFIVLSQAFQNILHQEYHIPRERIHIIPPGVEMQHFNPNISLQQARTQLGWPQDRPIILSVRRLAKRMGLENLIAAIDKIRYSYPDVLLMIAGKGYLADTLQKQIQELNLEDHVQLLGFMPDEDLPVAYRAANFSVVPTVAYEGFGLIIIESLAAGTPVLGTPVDSIPEILSPLSQDCLFESASSQHLAQGIQEVLSGIRQLPNQQHCRDYVAANYTWPVIAQRIRSVYELAITDS
ncbi:glycosyltransferase family 4 protein [Alkalinema sp. FACHB-956]|nr:glycosyltransferase family 4 protein [Alkalinema sp. FACHB-956]